MDVLLHLHASAAQRTAVGQGTAANVQGVLDNCQHRNGAVLRAAKGLPVHAADKQSVAYYARQAKAVKTEKLKVWHLCQAH